MARAIALVKGPTIRYAELNCQAPVERCVTDGGEQMAYAGSNDMARNGIVYLATLENAQADGMLVPGAGVMIHMDDGMEPARYLGDGLGKFDHVGLFVGKNVLYDTDKSGKERLCDIVRSSRSMDEAVVGRGICGSTLRNAWTHAVAQL